MIPKTAIAIITSIKRVGTIVVMILLMTVLNEEIYIKVKIMYNKEEPENRMILKLLTLITLKISDNKSSRMDNRIKISNIVMPNEIVN